jgi:hypothetical protein
MPQSGHCRTAARGSVGRKLDIGICVRAEVITRRSARAVSNTREEDFLRPSLDDALSTAFANVTKLTLVDVAVD